MGFLTDVGRTFGLLEDPEDVAVTSHCANSRPGQAPRIKCPGVGPQVSAKKIMPEDGEEPAVCAPQPPACCESAKRAEWAVKELEKLIRENPILNRLQMSSVAMSQTSLVCMAAGGQGSAQSFLGQPSTATNRGCRNGLRRNGTNSFSERARRRSGHRCTGGADPRAVPVDERAVDSGLKSEPVTGVVCTYSASDSFECLTCVEVWTRYPAICDFL
eukprot:TRINITY_DN69794_c0_g1_i1.p1 TRINITY_DN69794_c0_g1~~TRINITY_DN69794_c0_g1_i1.p1  ORF type:complete len:216 (+),score=12.48 TRINITY_DN69794_c0_g1_i1:57-704(+)